VPEFHGREADVAHPKEVVVHKKLQGIGNVDLVGLKNSAHNGSPLKEPGDASQVDRIKSATKGRGGGGVRGDSEAETKKRMRLHRDLEEGLRVWGEAVELPGGKVLNVKEKLVSSRLTNARE